MNEVVEKAAMIKCCKVCYCYQNEEIGDSDYGARYAEEHTCCEQRDCGADEELIADFDRDCERDCCKLNFWAVLEVDEELTAIFNGGDDGDHDGQTDAAYARFREKYLGDQPQEVA